VKKTLEAEDISLLRHLLEMELRRLHDEAEIDIILFMGIDGRIFSSYIPHTLNTQQYFLLSLVRSNLPHICAQLRSENLKISLQQYEEGILILSGVGNNAFIACIIATDIEIAEVQERIASVVKASAVLKHVFELRPLNESELVNYPEEISNELMSLSRLLFKERFTYTKDYKKNVEILENIKTKIESVMSKGQVNEIVTLTFNELGTQLGTMNNRLWMQFLELVINNHIQPSTSDLIAEECRKTWIPEIERKLKSFV
jgi:hypothetical protein